MGHWRTKRTIARKNNEKGGQPESYPRKPGGRLFRLLYAYETWQTYFLIRFRLTNYMAFFENAITVLQTLVIALGAGLGIWGVINLLEGYGNDNPGANAHVR